MRTYSAFSALGYVTATGLAVILILGWLLVTPFFRLGICLGDFYHGQLTIK